MKGEFAFGFKDTYWNKLRVERGYKLKELAEVLDMNLGTLGAFFTGQSMPKDETIKAICDLFGIDFGTGKLAFEHAHRAWDAEHKRTYRLPPNKDGKSTVQDIHAQEVLAVAEQFNQKVERSGDVDIKVVADPIDYSLLERADKVLELLYTRISYDEFKKCYRAIMEGKDIRRVLFDIVDFDTYTFACKVLSEA